MVGHLNVSPNIAPGFPSNEYWAFRRIILVFLVNFQILYHLHFAAMSEEGIVLALINAIRSDHKDEVIHHLSGQSDAVAVLALFHACAQGSILVVQEMAQRHLHLFNARNKDGQTLLHVAASNGNHFIVMLLLEIKPELCVMCDNSCEIPLHLAAKNGHRDVVERLLLAYPDSLEIANFRHEMALHLALKSSESSTALYLLQEIERQKKQYLLHLLDICCREPEEQDSQNMNFLLQAAAPIFLQLFMKI